MDDSSDLDLYYNELDKSIRLWAKMDGGKGLNNNLDELIKAIEQNADLEKLNLSHNPINKMTLANWKKLAAAIAKHTTLKVLNLTSSMISDEVVKHLAAALKKNKTLEKLHLDWNNIGNEGAKCLADMLSVNKTLRLIDLSTNNIGDNGAQSIAKALTKNTSLRTLDLHDNDGGITDVGAEKLADALIDNHSIRNLDVYNNNDFYYISEDIIDRIKTILKDPKRKIQRKSHKRTRTENIKDEEIALLRAKLKAQEEVITTKEKEIVSLKGALESYKPVTVDLANEEEDEPSSKRARTDDTSTSMEIWDKDTPRMMTRHQNQMNRASEKPVVKLENKVLGFKRCPIPECNTIGLFTKGCSIVTCRMNMRHNGKFHHFCFYCGKSASDPGDSCNNGVCPYKIDEDSRKLYQDNLDKAFKEFSRQTRQAGGAYDVDKV